MELNERQIKTGAMYLAVTNSGLYEPDEKYDNDRDVEMSYNRWNNESEAAFGPGLEEERQGWEKDLREGKYVTLLKKYLPWLFIE